MLPQAQQHCRRVTRRRLDTTGLDGVFRREQDALEHTRELAHVEDVVELRRSRQQVVLGEPPHLDGRLGQRVHNAERLVVKLALREAATKHLTVDIINRVNVGQDEVEHEEVTLGTVRNVVLATSRVVHRGNVLQILAVLHITALILVQEAEAVRLNQLAHDLQRRLVTPSVHQRHRHIIQEHSHLLAVGRTKRLAATLVELRFDRALEHARRGRRRKVNTLQETLLRVERAEEHQRDRRLGGTCASNHKNGQLLDVQSLQKEDRASGVHGRHEQVGKVQNLSVGVLPSLRAPALPLQGAGVDEVLVHGLSLADLGALGRTGLLAQFLVEQNTVLGLQQTTNRPCQAVQEQALHLELALLRVRREARLLAQLLEEVAKSSHHANTGRGQRLVTLPRLEVEQLTDLRRRVLTDVLGAQVTDDALVLLRASAHPSLEHWRPVKIRVRHVDDTGTGHSRGRGIVQVLVLEHNLDIVSHRDSITGGKSQNTVIVKHGVEILNPDSVDRAVTHDPSVVRVLAVVELLPHGGEDSLRPLAGQRVSLTVHLFGTDGLRVEARLLVDDVLDCRERRLQNFNDAGLATAGGARKHDAVAHQRRLVQLHNLEHPRCVVNQAGILNSDLDLLFDGRVLGLRRRLDLREQVREK
mmetsp:Transcript_53887/g.129836  ORF Transcript_53887/g.129836 Transcript_53887/m.129836 type:complete len:642 (-) Transcript_53887:378-2303(-)